MDNVVLFRSRAEIAAACETPNDNQVEDPKYLDDSPLGIALEQLMLEHGITLTHKDASRHFMTLMCMIRGMEARARGVDDKDGMDLYMDCIGEVLGYNAEPPKDDPDGQFADLLGKLD